MQMFNGFKSSYLSLAGMTLTIYGLALDVSVAVYVGITVVFVERLVIMALMAYALRIRNKLGAQLYAQMNEAAANMLKEMEKAKQPGPPLPDAEPDQD